MTIVGISTVIYLLLSLQLSLRVSLQENILRRIYEGISATIHLLSSLLTSLRCKVIQPSLHASLRNKFLRSSVLASLWNIFLRHLYEDISTVTPIPSKPEMFVQGIHSKPEILLQNIRGFVIVPKQVKPEAPKSWLPSHSSLQPYVKSFYKFVTYYMIDHNYNIDTLNIRNQVAGYIMSLKRKRRAKLKAKGCVEGCYH